MFALSHHPPEEFDRCYRFGSSHICARCLGTYPVMFAAIAFQVALHAPLEHPLDLVIGVSLVLPATIDWALGRSKPHRFSNFWRTSTGVLLGLGLGRSLFVHLQRPVPAVLLAQAMVVTAIALPVILIAYRRKRRR